MNRHLILICCICAISASPMQNFKRLGRLRIVNGEQIEIQVVPTQVSIIKLTKHEGEEMFGYHSCGGTILSKNLVLTAGHCVDLEPKDYLIRSGSTTWFEGGSLHKVVKIIRHEDYLTDANGRIHHDIAIMKVEPEFEVDGVTEKFTKLADEDDKVKHDDDAYVSGWGLTEEYTIPDKLRGLTLKIVDSEVCSEFYERTGNMTKNHICAQNSSGVEYVCKGDSGGPLIVNGKQVGIASWADPVCTIYGSPAVFVDVARYRKWIDEHMGI